MRMVASRGQAGKVIASNVRCIVAPNPGPMTGPGTNTYIVGAHGGPYLVIDPGVDDEAHLDRIERATGSRIEAILLTHRHRDHTGGATRLAAACRAPIRAFAKPSLGPHDDDIPIDIPLIDEERMDIAGLTLEAVHSPGHAADHLCFFMPGPGLLFAGDSVMADVTVVILPPDGDMSAYLSTLDRLERLGAACIAPGHGRALPDPPAVLDEIRRHRLAREAQVHAALCADRTRDAVGMAADLYPTLDARLRPMAAAQVEAHLIRLAQLGRARRTGGGWRSAGD